MFRGDDQASEDRSTGITANENWPQDRPTLGLYPIPLYITLDELDMYYLLQLQLLLLRTEIAELKSDFHVSPFRFHFSFMELVCTHWPLSIFRRTEFVRRPESMTDSDSSPLLLRC